MSRNLPLFRTLLAGMSLGAVMFLASGSLRAADDAADSLIQRAFEGGTLSEGQQALENALAAPPAPGDSAVVRERYALAIVEFLRSAETMGQAWHRFGLNADRATEGLPFLRLPVGAADPASVAPLSYEQFRTVFTDFLAHVQVAERSFAALPEDPGAVSLRPGLVRLDYVGDGKPASTETLWLTYQRLNLAARFTAQDAGGFLIRFDAGDVPWFRGYCHILSALAETVLAYDESRLFDHTAQMFFARPETSFPFLLARPSHEAQSMFELSSISDLVAFVHLLDFPVREPARLRAALDHLTQVPALSRESWRRIEAETDDDHEWIPNPRQTGVLPGVQVTQEKIDAWLQTLAEADEILAGRKLLPFWRGQPGETRGVNLRRVFTEPTDFDLVLWMQGTQAAPYLEAGSITDARLWQGVGGAFGGNALGFALYFN